jgi:hypothetical protein
MKEEDSECFSDSDEYQHEEEEEAEFRVCRVCFVCGVEPRDEYPGSYLRIGKEEN